MDNTLSPSEVYRTHIVRLPEGLPNRVLEVLKQHRGLANRITRRDLIEQVFEISMIGKDLQNLTEDRQLRMAIEELQGHYPVLGSSSEGGYYYANNAREIDRYIREINSRVNKMLDKARRLQEIAQREFGPFNVTPSYTQATLGVQQ